MSTLTHALPLAPARAIPVRLPAWPLRVRAEWLARWQARRLQRTQARTLARLDPHARRDLGLPEPPPSGWREPGLQLLARIGPV